MKAKSRFVKSAFAMMTTAAVFMVSGLIPVAIGSEAEFFAAESHMCFLDESDVYVIQKGKGKTITGNRKFFWRLTSKNPLMEGWQYNVEEHSVNKKGKTKINGELVMYPDVIDGYFAETYSFKSTDPISGTYIGFSGLNGVTVNYEVTITDKFGYCDELPPEGCGDGCFAIRGPIATMTGVIVDERAE